MAHEVRFSHHGGPEVLEVVEVPIPEPGEGEVLVEVFAAGLNPVDSSIRRGDHPGRWPVQLPARQGRDLAGVVIATGPEASRQERRSESGVSHVSRSLSRPATSGVHEDRESERSRATAGGP